ncbi:MAG TPA: hypothetical protein VJ965_04570 [Anaerolineales bacterium]|nr:hypothetical protein [Anaerolineales bacterium]
MDVEIRKMEGLVYANVRGAAWIRAIGIGQITFADIPDLMKIELQH